MPKLLYHGRHGFLLYHHSHLCDLVLPLLYTVKLEHISLAGDGDYSNTYNEPIGHRIYVPLYCCGFSHYKRV